MAISIYHWYGKMVDYLTFRGISYCIYGDVMPDLAALRAEHSEIFVQR